MGEVLGEKVKIIAQKILAIFLIFATVISYFPVNVFAEDETNDNFNPEDLLSVYWKENEEKIQGYTNTSYVFTYNITAATRGINNVVVEVTTDRIENCVDSVSETSGNGFLRRTFDNFNKGEQKTVSESVRFGNKETMDRTVTIKLTGNYINPETNATKKFTVIKTLEANIVPYSKNVYNADLRWQKDYNNNEISPSYSKKTDTVDDSVKEIKHTCTKEVVAKYPIHITSEDLTKNLELHVIINRKDLTNNGNYENAMNKEYEIDWGGLDFDFGQPQINNLANGSVEYVFSKGDKTENSTDENAFQVNQNYTVTITYQTPNTNPMSEKYYKATFVSFDITMNAIGFEKTVEYGKETVLEEKSVVLKKNESKSINLISSNPYGQGLNWVEYGYGTSDYLTLDEIQELKDNNPVTLNTNTFITRSTSAGTNETATGYFDFRRPSLKYISDNGEYKYLDLTTEQIRLSKITANNKSASDVANKLNVNSQSYEFNNEFIPDLSLNVNSFQIEVPNHVVNKTTFELEFTLSNINLTQSEISNILEVVFDMGASGNYCFGYGNATIKNYGATGISYPFYDVSLGNWDTNTRDEKTGTILLRMYKPSSEVWNNYGTDKDYQYINIKNENPIFYIELPSGFDYDWNSIANKVKILESGTSLKIDSVNCVKRKNLLIVACSGTFSSTDSANLVRIEIGIPRTMTADATDGENRIRVKMVTDNEMYPTSYYADKNTELYKNSKGEVANKYILRNANFNCTKERSLRAVTYAQIDDNRFGNSKADLLETGEIEEPKIVESGTTVKIQSSLDVFNQSINNIEVISSLPYAQNKDISINNEPQHRLIDDNYVLNEKFVSDNKNNLKGIDENGVVNQISLENVKFNGVYVDTIKVSPQNYTVYYSTQDNVNFDTDSSAFQQYDETTDLSTAKVLKVVFNENYSVQNKLVYVEYEATMPQDSVGMVGATAAVKYTRTSDGFETELVATPVYIISGKTSGSIVLKKKFEDYSLGSKPEGIDFTQIQFKLYSINEYGEKIYVKNEQGNDLIVNADQNGVATFNNLDVNEAYSVEEITEFDDYKGIQDKGLICLDEGETREFVVVNKLKRGIVQVNKTWKDALGAPTTAILKIERVKRDDSDIGYSATTTTNAEGIAVFNNVPYGTYKVTEESTDGWILSEESKEKTVIVNNEETAAEVDVENIPVKGNVKITKLISDEDTVNGLTFHITGRSLITYTDLNGNVVSKDLDVTVKIGETEAQNEINVNYGEVGNITIEKAADNKSATILLEDVYAGRYEAEEVEIPLLEDETTPKFTANSADGILYINGDTLNLDITNSWKKGTLKIVKTVEDGVELKGFKVRVKCDRTYYGTSYDKTFDIPENGVVTIENLYLGNYTVTEIDSDYFNAKYGDDKSNDPITVEIKDDQITTAKIFNECAYGNVRVLKTLEGKDATETKGIKFRLYGKDATGADVDIVKEIVDTVEYQGKTYGVIDFENVQAGGEYELQEVEETVPNYFVVADSMAVDVTKLNTQEDPLIIKVDNKRGIGNLEITTKTNPEGGDLSGIEYDVTEIKIQDNTVVKIGKATHLVGIAGFAEIKNLNSGMYIVEQTSIPDGYIKDYPQIVEVPVEETGYVEFEIEKPELAGALLTVEKELYTKNGNVATEADIKAAKLDVNETFEAIITDKTQNKVYYVFFDVNNPGKLKGLPVGTYEIEEVYKPKYLATEYFVKNGDEYNSIKDSNRIFTIAEETTDVTIKIRNTINTDFGFGGQSSKDNYAKVTMEEVSKTTRSIIYIADEDDRVVTGAKFKIYRIDENGNQVEVQLSFEDNTYVVDKDKRVIIYGLPVGNYVIKSVGDLPEGYIKPEDKEFKVFEKATVVTRVEIMKNKPRGKVLTLSTKYIDDDGEKQFVPSSEYKILDKLTNKVLKFKKTASGNYVRSNAADAVESIKLRKGSVEVSGIEVGSYQLGLVGMTETYGIINTKPEDLVVTDGSVIEKEVIVKERGGFVKVDLFTVHDEFGVALTKTGELYEFDESGIYNLNEKFTILNEIKVKDFVLNYFSVYVYLNREYVYKKICTIIDNEGKVWKIDIGLSQIECISDREDFSIYGLKIEKIASDNSSGVGASAVNVITENGVVYGWDYKENSTPKNISEGTILEGKKIVQIEPGGSSGNSFAIDDEGKVYFWGYTYNYMKMINEETERRITEPICVSDIEGVGLNNLKIKYVDQNSATVYFIDYNNDLWVCGRNYDGSLGLGTENSELKVDCVCLTKENNIINGKKIEYIYATNTNIFVLDSDGNLYGWGVNRGDYILGRMPRNMTIPGPIGISSKTNSIYNFNGLKLKNACFNNYTACAIDEKGDLWFWGGVMGAVIGRTVPSVTCLPERIDNPQNAYFELFEVDDIQETTRDISSETINTPVLDKSGNLWVYNGSEIIQLGGLEKGVEYCNEKIKDYAITYSESSGEKYVSGGVVTEDGDLWLFGYVNDPYAFQDICSPYSYSTDRDSNDHQRNQKPVCVTSISGSVFEGKKIVEIEDAGISGTSNTYAVIDEDGKLYTGGSGSSSNLGYISYAPSSYWSQKAFECVNNKYDNLKDVKFIKVCVINNYRMIALDSNGKVWVWGNSNSYSGTTIYDISKPVMLTQGDFDDSVKIVDIAVSDSNAIALDENGNVYVWGNSSSFDMSSSQTPTKVIPDKTLYNDKDIVKVGACSSFRAVMDSNGGIYYESGSLLSEGIVAKDWYFRGNAMYVKDTEDKIWKVTSSGIEDLTIYTTKELAGVKIDGIIDYNTIVSEGENSEKLYIVNSSGTILSTYELEGISNYDIVGQYTFITDSNNHIWVKKYNGSKLVEYTGGVVKQFLCKGLNSDYFIDENNDIYSISSTGCNKIDGFDEGTVITNIIEGKYKQNGITDLVARIYAQDEDNNLWIISGTSAIKVDGYTGGKIVEAKYIFFKDENKKIFKSNDDLTLDIAFSNKMRNVDIEYFEGNIETARNSTPILVALDSNGKVYCSGIVTSGANKLLWGYDSKYTSFEDGYIYIIRSNLGKYKIATTYFAPYTSSGKTNYYYMIVLVTEDNKIYSVTPGQNPRLASNSDYLQCGNIISAYGDRYLIDEYGNKIYLGMSHLANSTRVTCDYTKVPDINFTVKDGYIEYSNGDIGIWNGSSYTRYTYDNYFGLPQSSLSLTDDGKLYWGQKQINDIIVDKMGIFARRFVLIKDAKYND